ncbi:MAG: glycosyltransferase [Dermatophilaceae bacterium]
MTSQGHVFLTRYNLPTPGVESMVRAKEGWLKDRTALFEQYTVPSMRAQTAQDLKWIVYIDPQSPAWLLDRMECWRSEGLLTPIPRESVSSTELLADLRKVLGRSEGVLVTTNLDNDDGLAVDFAERVQSASVGARDRAAVYLTTGIIKSDDSVYLRQDPHNAFCSVVEDLSNPVTCWADWHNRLSEHMAVVCVDGDPAWLQVIHGDNVSNRVRGKMVRPGPYTGFFPPGLLGGARTPARSTIFLDEVVRGPYRIVRDEARGAARRTAVRLMGKSGFEALKTRLAHFTSSL